MQLRFLIRNKQLITLRHIKWIYELSFSKFLRMLIVKYRNFKRWIESFF